MRTRIQTIVALKRIVDRLDRWSLDDSTGRHLTYKQKTLALKTRNTLYSLYIELEAHR